jgi:cytoskeleton protein RodZ
MNAPVADDEDIEFDQASPSASSAVIDSPGRALHDARRACKLEIVRIANELRLSPETIDALERDDFEHLPSAVFVSGYIRTYARLLELDPEPLIARFRELHPEAEAPPRVAARASHPAQQPGSGKMPVLLPLVLLVAIAAASYLWWSGNGRISNGTEEPASAEAGPDASPVSPAPTPELYQPDRQSANLDPTEPRSRTPAPRWSHPPVAR